MAYSNEALAVLKMLGVRKNVLISGPPSCGKTRLMQEVADAFLSQQTAALAPKEATMVPSMNVPIPALIPAAGPAILEQLPSPDRKKRFVERIAFSANTRARDFTTAYVPAIGGGMGFQVGKGALVRANEAALAGGAALLIIDELNRGPAVQLFGDGIVALEADKRLLSDDSQSPFSWPLQVLDDTGQGSSMYLSSHLYVLAAMNQADVSVEPLDVAFLRRFAPINLRPNPDYVRSILGASGGALELPDVPGAPGDVIEAALRAWEFVNSQIALGRGPDFQLGHGVFLANSSSPSTVGDATIRAVDWWQQIASHVKEVFFGDMVGMGIAFRAGTGSEGYRIVETPYGQDQKQHLADPELSPQAIYGVLKRIAGA